MNRGLVTLFAITLSVVACGGSDADEPTSSSSTEAKSSTEGQPTAADTSTTEPEARAEPVSSGAEGTGSATIGDMTWEFKLSGNPNEWCDLDVSDAGVAFQVVMFGTDDSGREIALAFGGPISGGVIRVQAGSPGLDFERWTAVSSVYESLSGDEGLPEGVGATVQFDGNTVSGSGVFYDDTALNQVRLYGGIYESGVLEGTFSATCPTV